MERSINSSGVRGMDTPRFYAKDSSVFQVSCEIPRSDGSTSQRMGFKVCEVMSGVDPEEVAELLDAGERAIEKAA